MCYSPSVRVELGFDITTISVREDKRLVELCVTVFWPSILQREVDVLVNTHDITASEAPYFLHTQSTLYNEFSCNGCSMVVRQKYT